MLVRASSYKNLGGDKMRKYLLSATAVCAVLAGYGTAFADEAAAQKWIDQEFQPSSLSKAEQLDEMKWFIDAAAPFKGMEINVLSEGIPTHGYESEVLTKAFEDITGIKVNHQILGEGEVVQAVQTQMQTQRNLYDGYVNDSDLIGTHSRLQLAYNLTEQMAGDWAATTSPTLDLDALWACSSPPVRMATCISCPTSSSPTSTGSAKTGSTVKT
jgi:glycerol transport system substrate-binding protein